MPEITYDLARHAALWITHHLQQQRVLVDTDRSGYELALQLASVAGARADLEVHATLAGLVQRSIDRGQQPPKGW
jgi:hypothetical protein